MKINDGKLTDIYNAIKLYVSTNFTRAVITEKENSTIISYPGELARIFIFKNKKDSFIGMKFTTKINSKMSNNNGITFIISDIEDINEIKAAIKVILSIKSKYNT